MCAYAFAHVMFMHEPKKCSFTTDYILRFIYVCCQFKNNENESPTLIDNLI